MEIKLSFQQWRCEYIISKKLNLSKRFCEMTQSDKNRQKLDKYYFASLGCMKSPSHNSLKLKKIKTKKVFSRNFTLVFSFIYDNL